MMPDNDYPHPLGLHVTENRERAARASLAAPTGSASRLWRVTVEYELLVVADSERQAESEAEYYAGEDGSEPMEKELEPVRKKIAHRLGGDVTKLRNPWQRIDHQNAEVSEPGDRHAADATRATPPGSLD